MTAPPGNPRRRLSRALTRATDASVHDALAWSATDEPGAGVRIGVTGAPGAGKSTLIARLARRLLEDGARVGVLAIDPSSPLSQGSMLGDRVRMDAVAGHPDLYIRSVPSRRSTDGLSDNVSDLLLTMESYGFDHVVLETVGVGQSDTTVRNLVDTVVLVLQPDSGDAVQAMKAGILEVADVYVVNKDDLAGGEKLAAELRALLGYRARDPDGWRPPVLRTSRQDEDGVRALAGAIADHRRWRDTHVDPAGERRARLRVHIRSLIQRRVDEILDASDPSLYERPLAEVYRTIAGRLGGDAEAGLASLTRRR